MKKHLFSWRHLFVPLRPPIVLLLILLSCLQYVPLNAQTVTVRGIVKDGNGTALNAVTVTVKGTSIGTTTNTQGKFTLAVPNKNAVLTFSSIGYGSKDVTVGNQTNIDMVLTAGNSSMDEVVVIGYGTQRKKDVTGAISSVSAKQIQERQAVDVLDAMQGQAPGLQIAQESGRPGAGASVRIRGIGTFQGGVDPLYIVDGAQGVNIDGINPNDIESIEILKDAASAAIYGSRSANGVVIITTKKGREGKPNLDLRYLSGLSKLSHKIPQANAAERRLLDYKRGGAAGLNTDSINPSINADNDYQDELTRTALRQQVDLSLGGGSPNLNYYGSLGYLKDEGIILNSWANIMRGRFNIDYHPNSKFTYGNRIQFSYSTENRINEGNTLNQAIQRPPNFRIYLPDGTLAGNLGGRKNPVAEALLRTNKYDILDGNFYNYISYNFLPELKWTVDANVSVNYTHNVVFEPKLLSNTGVDNDGSDERDWRTYWMLQSYLNYNKTFGGIHALTAMLGVSADRNYTDTSQINGINYATESVITLNSAQAYNPIPSTTAARYTSVSAFGRLGYSYKGKYLFNSNFRADASSKFGKDNRWGYFPSASVGWRFSEESFMKWAYKYLDDGKLRASYGITGNDRIGPYDAIRQYTFGDSYYNSVSGIASSGTFGNNHLSWEQTKQLNFGIDLTLLRGRLTFTADYYDKTTSKLLYKAPLAYETGFSNVNVNIGSIQNKGLEFIVGGYPVRNNNFQWNVMYNMSFNNAIIKELYGNIPIASGNWKTEVGQRIGNFYGWQALGVYQYDQSNAYTDDWEQLTPVFDNSGTFSGYTLNGKAYSGNVNRLKTQGNVLKGGDMIWQNTNKDSVIDDNDRIILGNAQPKWIAGLSNMFNYKNFSLSFNIYVSWGGMIYDRGRQQLNTNATTNVTPDPEYIRDSWWHQGDITKWAVAKNNGMGNARELSSQYLEDASFIRLRNVRFTYGLPKNLLSKVKMKGASVYLYGNNLLTWTNYFWYDPEISFNNPLQMGQDNGRYPRKREVGAGINLNF